MEIQVVTGYVPLPYHPRTAAEYGKLGAEIFGPLHLNGVNIRRYMDKVEDTWLHKYVSRAKKPPTHSVGDNPVKNSLNYHCVQHQKFGWLLKAAIENPKADQFVWIDYGIGHVPGVTVKVIWEYLQHIQQGDFAVPGCWTKDHCMLTDAFPCWRFCGGVMTVPRPLVHRLYKAVKGTALDHVNSLKNVTWEVNTMAEAEANGRLPPVRWYAADHNETMFTNYVQTP